LEIMIPRPVKADEIRGEPMRACTRVTVSRCFGIATAGQAIR
jgi:hypothetical protein